MINVNEDEVIITTEEEVYEIFETEEKEPTKAQLKEIEKDFDFESYKKEEVVIDVEGDKKLEQFIQRVMFMGSNVKKYKEDKEVESLHDKDYVEVKVVDEDLEEIDLNEVSFGSFDEYE